MKKLYGILSILKVLAVLTIIFFIPFSSFFYILFLMCGMALYESGTAAVKLRAATLYSPSANVLFENVFTNGP